MGRLASSLDASLTLAPGRRLGRYAVVRRLAVGGMAELHLARILDSTEPNPYVVIKRVLPHLALDEQFVALFRNEAQISALLHHPNIVEVTEVAQIEDELCYVMRYVHGENLRKLLKKAQPHGGIPLHVALSIVCAAARGLHHAHEQRGMDGRPLGLVHRDITPSNLLIGFDGRVRVADFGIAKAVERTEHTRGSMMKGKVGYMSPEQCQGARIDRRSDVHALGILLYEATTSARMFWAEGDFAILSKIVTGDYVAPSERSEGYPDALAAIIERAVQVEAEHRYPTAAAFGMAVEGYAFAHGIDLCETHVAAFMLQVLGSRPEPGAELADTLAPIAASPLSDAGPRPRPAWVLPLAMAATLAGGVGLGQWLDRGDGTTAEPAVSEPDAAPNARPVAAPPQPVVAAAEPDPDPEAIVVEEPAASEPPATSTKPKPKPKSKPKRSRRKSRKKPKPDASKSLFPDEF
ncbi:MAG: serine/threonine protein kinase [Nannocystaceae bacterium]|nr:protein kinase [bacterium]